jgi:signal transduction histidine kinase
MTAAAFAAAKGSAYRSAADGVAAEAVERRAAVTADSLVAMAPRAGALPDAAAAALGEDVQSAFEYLPVTLLGMIAGTGVVTLLFWQVVPRALMLPWLAAFTVLWLLRLLMLRRYRSAVLRGSVDWAAWYRVWTFATLVSGALWGLTAWLFYGRGSAIQHTGLIIIVYTYCIAAVPVLANHPRIYASFAALCFVPMIARIASEGDLYSYQLAGELLLIVSLTTLLARSYRHALQRVTELKLRSDELLRQLRVEKHAAEIARRDAEIANRAKTQFFAAASHDLRQPLHAMGLFAEALRQRVHEREVAELVNSINESVDALEGLFSELLDITRIDSGKIEVNAKDVVVQDILRKLRLHFEPAAFEKGLALRLRGGQHVVRADPLLLERVLRNLVSNAIRYTQDGSVLVGCRRRGNRALVQVWDTGIGMSPEDQQHVFEEFYQVQGRHLVTAEQRKGLGLGLAIVARLTKLMGAPLALRSRPGRGTVFTLELPIGKAAPPFAGPASTTSASVVTLAGRTIVVIEDDRAVREGLEVLLNAWGASVAAFDSVGAAEAWAAATDRNAERPALLLVDYRLEQGRTGVDAIASLRAYFAAALPAVLVTGSTTSDHEQEALSHDFHVLTKPVLPNKLRAMISFKLGAAPVAAAGPASKA